MKTRQHNGSTVRSLGFRVVLAALLGAAGIAFLAAGAGKIAATEARTVDLRVLDASGRTVTMHFLIRAETDEQALVAARAAAVQLNPAAGVAKAAGEATAQFAPWGWQWNDNEIPVVVAYNPDGAPAGLTAAPVANALKSWSDVPGSRFRFEYEGVTDAQAGTHASHFDGANVISWMDLDCGAGCVLGVTSKVDDLHEIDIVLNSSPLARIGDGGNGTLDLETVVLHEAGHMAGLEHSCQPLLGACTQAQGEAIMFFRYRGIHRTLGADDIAGLLSLYGDSGSPQEAPREGLPAEQSVVAVSTQPGWNLALLPASDMQTIMKALPCVKAVYAVGANGQWLTWVRGANAALNTLTVASLDDAYWLSSDGSCSASFTALGK